MKQLEYEEAWDQFIDPEAEYAAHEDLEDFATATPVPLKKRRLNWDVAMTNSDVFIEQFGHLRKTWTHKKYMEDNEGHFFFLTGRTPEWVELLTRSKQGSRWTPSAEDTKRDIAIGYCSQWSWRIGGKNGFFGPRQDPCGKWRKDQSGNFCRKCYEIHAREIVAHLRMGWLVGCKYAIVDSALARKATAKMGVNNYYRVPGEDGQTLVIYRANKDGGALESVAQRWANETNGDFWKVVTDFNWGVLAQQPLGQNVSGIFGQDELEELMPVADDNEEPAVLAYIKAYTFDHLDAEERKIARGNLSGSEAETAMLDPRTQADLQYDINKRQDTFERMCRRDGIEVKFTTRMVYVKISLIDWSCISEKLGAYADAGHITREKAASMYDMIQRKLEREGRWKPQQHVHPLWAERAALLEV